jgi:chaperonin GroEL
LRRDLSAVITTETAVVDKPAEEAEEHGHGHHHH